MSIKDAENLALLEQDKFQFSMRHVGRIYSLQSLLLTLEMES